MKLKRLNSLLAVGLGLVMIMPVLAQGSDEAAAALTPEQRKAQLRALIQAQRVSTQPAKPEHHLSPEERARLREAVRQQSLAPAKRTKP